MLVARAAERVLTDKSVGEQRLEIRVQIPGKAEEGWFFTFIFSDRDTKGHCKPPVWGKALHGPQVIHH